MVGIVAYGGYVPRLRLARKAVAEANAWFNAGLKGMAKDEKAICNWDEDALTMAVEAARDCLVGVDRNTLKAVYLASTTLPFQDRLNSGVVCEALTLGDNTETLDITSSQRAATSGLIAAMRAVEAGAGPLLFLTAEKRRTRAASPQEMNYGDGAAALLLDKGPGIAELVAHESMATDFVDHYRGAGNSYDYTWEERWIRDEGYNKIVPPVVKALLDKTKLKGADIAKFVMPCTLRGVAGGIAKKQGIAETAVHDNLHASMGDAGAAHPLVLLVHAMQDCKPGDKVMLVSFGQGCDALLFEVKPAIADLKPRNGIKGFLARRKSESNYNKFLAFNEVVDQEKGMRAELDKQTALTTLYRKRGMLMGLVGGKCRQCGTLQYPKSKICVNPNCNAMHMQDDHPFADMPARILSYTADLLTYSPDPPQHYGMVQFEDGGRLMADFTDVDVGKVDAGMPMRMVFRVKEYDAARGFTKYFWKATPAGEGKAG